MGTWLQHRVEGHPLVHSSPACWNLHELDRLYIVAYRCVKRCKTTLYFGSFLGGGGGGVVLWTSSMATCHFNLNIFPAMHELIHN